MVAALFWSALYRVYYLASGKSSVEKLSKFLSSITDDNFEVKQRAAFNYLYIPRSEHKIFCKNNVICDTASTFLRADHPF